MPERIPVAFNMEEKVEIPVSQLEVANEKSKVRNEEPIINISLSEGDIEKAKGAREVQRQKTLPNGRADFGVPPERHESEPNEVAKLEKAQIDKTGEVSREHSFDDLTSELNKAGFDTWSQTSNATDMSTIYPYENNKAIPAAVIRRA